jgi:hypothetical protein
VSGAARRVAVALLLMLAGAGPARAQAAGAPRPPRAAHLPLIVQPDTVALCRLDPAGRVPAWAAPDRGFVALTRTPTELSLVISQSRLPGGAASGAACERDYRPVRVAGGLPLDLVGIVAGMTRPLAEAGISIFALSTYETDYVFVKQRDLARAMRAWRRAGHTVTDSVPTDSVPPPALPPSRP